VPTKSKESTEFNPMGMVPKDITASRKSALKKLGTRAKTSYKAAVILKCLECVAWYRPEILHCKIFTCPLYAVSVKIYGRKTDGDSEETQEESQ
jgi:hypothetical protein